MSDRYRKCNNCERFTLRGTMAQGLCLSCYGKTERTLDNEIVGLLQRRPGLDLFQLAQLTEIKQGSQDNPLASPLNQTLKRMRDAGRIRTNNQWGAPRFFLCLESDLHVEKGRN